uniref:Uncharacterized protein n=1 Tax=Mimiviridae sp. ChoanoV1 TaxID=2596887 RepID=A0A5B8HX80_9VIRU|nr:hypothetical protein 1_195 [Mimiviridae sp. ChoanoV1]
MPSNKTLIRTGIVLGSSFLLYKIYCRYTKSNKSKEESEDSVFIVH